MKIFSADWILPITRDPIARGAVVVDDHGLIAFVDAMESVRLKFPGVPITHFENTVILPGLVNAHTHLELSMMRGVLSGNQKFPEWAYGAITRRFEFTPDQIVAACRDAVNGLLETGTIGVGDIANHSAVSWEILLNSGLFGVQFHEVTGFPSVMAASRFRAFADRVENVVGSRMSQSLGPHAPYSVSPELFRLIAVYCREHGLRTTVHLAESEDEVTFIRQGAGGFRDLLARLDRWDSGWTPPGTTPVRYLDDLGFLSEDTLVVHAVHVNDEDIRILRDRRVSVCTCPRSNARIDVGGVAPVEAMLAAGINMCVGTDSLASNDDLNLWNEMTDLKSKHPSLSSSTILKMATFGGAKALGLDRRIGSLDTGMEAAMIGVSSATAIREPADFLLSGFDAFAAVRRL